MEEPSTTTSDSPFHAAPRDLVADPTPSLGRILALQLLVGPIGMAIWTALEAKKLFPSRSASVVGIWSAMLVPVAVAVVLVIKSKSRRGSAVLWGLGSAATTLLSIVASVLLLLCVFGMAL